MADTNEQSTSQMKEENERKIEKRDVLSYQKRVGTSGISGQLYETKLLSLIYFKASHDDDIEEFFLAANVAEIGAFDDICLRAKFKGIKKPISVFVTAKHYRFMVNSKKDLANYFASYLKIKRRFQPDNADVLFKGNFNDSDCVFVMYTTAKDEPNSKPCEGSLVTYLNNMIATGNPGSQPSYTDEDLDLLCQQLLEEELMMLAQHVVKYMFGDVQSQMMFHDELVLKYHVILARHVFDISEIQLEGHRVASFKDDFFRQSPKFIQIFKDGVCSDILKRRKIDINNEMQDLLADFLSDPDNSATLCKLIRGSVLTLKNGNLEFRDQMILQLFKQQLDCKINSNKKDVRDEAVELAVRESKPSLEFKVPAVFGNKDLAIRGSDEKIDRKVDYLCQKLVVLMEKSKPDNIVTIDDSIDEGLLRLNGGLASAVGNIFVFDDTSKLFKFCENYESLGNIAQRFFTKLESQMKNMHDYRFKLRVKMFPKLSIDTSEYDEEAKDFISKLVFYTSQGDEQDVEKKVKDEIKKYQDEFHNPELRSEAIFLKYHDNIQKWWMAPTKASYLTKDDQLYKTAVYITDNASVRNVMPKI